MLLAGCAQDTEDNGPVLPGTGQGEFFGTFAATPDVKTSMEYDEASQKVKISWIAEDRIGIFGSKDGTSLKDNAEYKAVLDGGAPTGYFEAVDQTASFPWGDGAGTRTFHAYYPYDAAAASTGSMAYTIPAAQQQGAGMEHVAAAGLMTAVGTSASATRETIQLQFRSAFAVAEFIVKQAAGENITLRSVKLKGAAPLAGAATCDLATGTLTAAADASNEVTLTFGDAGLTLDEAGKSIYFLVLPGVHAAGTVQLVFTDVNGKVFTKPLWNSAERTFRANVTTRQPIAALASAVLNEPDVVTAFDLSSDIVTPSGTSGSALSLAPNGTQINDIDAENGEIVLTLQDNGTPMGTTGVNVPYSFKVASDEAAVSVPATGTFEFASVRDVKTFTVTAPSLTRASKTKTWKVRLVYKPQLNNAGFENKTTDSNSLTIFPGWATANMKVSFVTVHGTTQVANNGGYAAQLSTAYNSMGALMGAPITAASLFTGTFTGTTDAKNPRSMTNFGIPFYGSAKPKALQVDVKYVGAAKGNQGKVDVDVASICFELINHAVDAAYSYHGYGTDGKGPVTDSNVTADNYNSNATRVAVGTVYLSNTSDYSITVGGNSLPATYHAGEWETITIPVTETVSGLEPNYLSVSCTSSALGDQFLGNPGSVLLVDNIKIIYEE